MNGFSDSLLNQHIAIDILNHIVEKVLECFDLMMQDCSRNSHKIDNNETAIRDYLFCNYLNNDDVMRNINFDDFRFSSEVPENYVNSRPQGRTDLQIYSFDNFRFRERYFIIECKRIGGDLTLNRKYIDDGMCRFIGDKPKYTSYFKVNCMLGFVIKNIDIGENINRINSLLKNTYPNVPVQDYLHKWRIPNTYISSHGKAADTQITLIHAFPNCASVIS